MYLQYQWGLFLWEIQFDFNLNFHCKEIIANLVSKMVPGDPEFRLSSLSFVPLDGFYHDRATRPFWCFRCFIRSVVMRLETGFECDSNEMFAFNGRRHVSLPSMLVTIKFMTWIFQCLPNDEVIPLKVHCARPRYPNLRRDPHIGHLVNCSIVHVTLNPQRIPSPWGHSPDIDHRIRTHSSNSKFIGKTGRKEILRITKRTLVHCLFLP